MSEPYRQLEMELRTTFQQEDVVCCSSGTAALHLALECLKMPSGMEILIPDYTMIACARAATLAGLKPVFVDCGSDLLIDLDDMRKKCGPSVIAVMPVHIYGRRCPMAEIVRFAAEKGIYVIEDLAEAHGIAKHPDSDAACWSFYRNKIIAGEEGGAVAFKRAEKGAIARSLRSLGMGEGPPNYWHQPRGHNYRMSNLHADAVLQSLRNYRENLRLRLALEKVYREETPAPFVMPPRDVPWVYDVRIPGMTWDRQKEILAGLHERGIQARPGFVPMSLQPEYKDCSKGSTETMASKLSREVLYLPLSPTLPEEEARRGMRALVQLAQSFGLLAG